MYHFYEELRKISYKKWYCRKVLLGNLINIINFILLYKRILCM